MKNRSNSASVSICVIGSGYVGLVAAACFAELGHDVVCVDSDCEKIEILNQGGLPIYEEHLPHLLGKHLNQGVRFTTDLGSAVGESEAVFIAVGTPQNDNGAADLSYVEAVVSELASHIREYKVLIEKSTVPVYTNEWIGRVLRRYGVAPEHFDVVSNPEFLREGSAVKDFLHPDRIVVGARSERSIELLRRIYAPLTEGSYYTHSDAIPGACCLSRPPRMLMTSPQSAEIIKHASNAFLALKISFINAVSNLAETIDADIEEIAAGIGSDSRIGPKFLRAGIGYGGSCFPKDVAAFNVIAKERGVDFPLLEDIRRINEAQKDIFFGKILTALWTLRGKQIAALGLAFKGGTDDIRESPAIGVIRKVLEAGARVTVCDPAAMKRAQEILPPTKSVRYETGVYDAARAADAVIVLTDWLEFASIDLVRLKSVMRFPVMIDGRNLFDPLVMEEHGFTYLCMGRPARSGKAPMGQHSAIPDLDTRRVAGLMDNAELASPRLGI